MKTVLITGSTDGIGLATAVELSRRGLRVIIHGRNKEGVEAALRLVKEQSGKAEVETVAADLSSLEEVRGLARVVHERFERLDVLINNAGVTTRNRELSQDGFELTLAVNYIAPFLLTRMLLDLLKASSPARIINVSSMVHSHARLDLEDLQMQRSFDGYDAYARSKLAMILFTKELARRLSGSGVTVNALHPGVIDTKLLRVNFSGGADTVTGSRTPVYLAVSPEVEGISGEYFVARKPASISATAADAEVALELWKATTQLIGEME